MRMTGEERIAAPRSRVWEALNDPDVLRQCIPGCQSLQKESADKLRGVVEIKIGPISARFNCLITISDIDPAQSYTITAEGQGGTVGSGKSTIRVRLADDGNATRLSYEVDAQVGGRLAQLGGPIIDATAKQLAINFFKRFGEIVGGKAETPSVAATQASHVGSADSGSAATQLTLATSASSTWLPVAWMLALVAAVLVGFLIGRGNGSGGSDWMGLAIGLLVVVVAAAGFEYGRRSGRASSGS